MRVLIAFDKFKDSLTAREACETAARALRARHPDWQLDLCPLADGGDGFVDLLCHSAGGAVQKFPVEGPRGGLIEAGIGLVPLTKIPKAARELLRLDPIPPMADRVGPAAQKSRPAPAGAETTVAIVEMAAASGLALLPPQARDPWRASSYGTGQLIRAASELGAGAVLLGIGGSATHDLGLGALSALGFEFRGADGAKIRPPVPAQWPRLARIEGALYPSIPPIRIACDVSNPLLGPRGAAAVYAPQKGLGPADFERLEAATAGMAARLIAASGAAPDLAKRPGAGAAGGISFGLMAAAGALLLPGFELVSAWLNLEARVASADLVVTGEGRFDESSSEGKGPGAVAAQARRLGRPAHVFAGEIRGKSAVHLHAITPAGTPLPRALREARANLAAEVGRIF